MCVPRWTSARPNPVPIPSPNLLSNFASCCPHLHVTLTAVTIWNSIFLFDGVGVVKSWISFAILIWSPVGSACEPIHTYCMNPSRSWNPIAAMLSACMARNKVFVTTHNVVKILSYLHSASRRQPWQWSRWRRRKNRAQDNAFWTSSGQIKRRLPTKRRRIQESWRIWRKQRRRRRSGIRSNVIDISEKQQARSSTSEARSSISMLAVSWKLLCNVAFAGFQFHTLRASVSITPIPMCSHANLQTRWK